MLNLAAINSLIENIKTLDNRVADALRLIVKALAVIPNTDSGKAYCDAALSDGAVVELNRPFYQISGISVTPISEEAILPTVKVYRSNNITQFNVYLFDLAGNRVSADIYWIVYGNSR